MTENTVNMKTIDTIKRKASETYETVLVRLIVGRLGYVRKKVIIRARETIRRGAIGKKTLSNYGQS